MKRSELYVAVWARSTREVARECGVSDTWLHKVSRHYNVPAPPRGHWQKVRAGHEVQAVPLPEGEDCDVGLPNRPASAAALTVPAAAAGGEVPRKRRDPAESTSASAPRDLSAAKALLERHARQALQHRAMESMLADLTVALLMTGELDASDRRDWLMVLHEEVRRREPRSELIERAMKRFTRPKGQTR